MSQHLSFYRTALVVDDTFCHCFDGSLHSFLHKSYSPLGLSAFINCSVSSACLSSLSSCFEKESMVLVMPVVVVSCRFQWTVLALPPCFWLWCLAELQESAVTAVIGTQNWANPDVADSGGGDTDAATHLPQSHPKAARVRCSRGFSQLAGSTDQCQQQNLKTITVVVVVSLSIERSIERPNARGAQKTSLRLPKTATPIVSRIFSVKGSIRMCWTTWNKPH